jgi:hypothetical protein
MRTLADVGKSALANGERALRPAQRPAPPRTDSPQRHATLFGLPLSEGRTTITRH